MDRISQSSIKKPDVRCDGVALTDFADEEGETFLSATLDIPFIYPSSHGWGGDFKNFAG